MVRLSARKAAEQDVHGLASFYQLCPRLVNMISPDSAGSVYLPAASFPAPGALSRTNPCLLSEGAHFASLHPSLIPGDDIEKEL